MATLKDANRQWSKRPDDERYLTLASLREAVAHRRHQSRELDLCLAKDVSVVPTEDGNTLLLTDGEFEAPFTHWSFGQLAQRMHVPAAFLRELPVELAALNAQYALECRLEDTPEARAAKVLLGPDTNGGPLVARAFTSPTYGRIWDLEVVDAVIRYTEIAGGAWKIPSASYASYDPTRASTLYASDRDVFLFLVNESNPIEVPGTGGREKLHRGFFVWNSETGAATFGLTVFYYRFVCDNRIVWGAEQVQELRIRHCSQGPSRFLRQAAPTLRAFLDAPTKPAVTVFQRAMDHELGKNREEVIAFLRKRGWGQRVAESAYASAQQEGLNPRSVWGMVQGLTNDAHGLAHTDTRIEREREAGALLSLVG